MKKRRFEEETLSSVFEERLKQSFKTINYFSTLGMIMNCSSLRKKRERRLGNSRC